MQNKDIFKAWLDGTVIQERMYGGSEWKDCYPYGEEDCFKFDSRYYEYRIKPKPVTVKFKVYKSTIDDEIRVVCQQMYAVYDNQPNIWTCISEEQTVEVPVKS